MVAGSSYPAAIKTLNPNGRYLTGNPRLSVMLRCLLTTWFTDKTAGFQFAKETREELDTLRDMIEDGRISPIVDQVYPMEKAAAAHTRVETEQRLGAIVISVGADASE
jgi:NADPH:quinone reductase-like Zn-dependent oxidoreductase